MPYPGGKSSAGVYQRLINQIPPHDVYVEPFAGEGAILRRLAPAARSIAIDSDPKTLAKHWTGDERPDLELYCCDGIEWLKHQFGLYRFSSAGPPVSASLPGEETGNPLRDDPQSGSVAGASTGNLLRTGRAHAAQSGGEGLRWFVYCDPPYLRSTRLNGAKIYRHEMTDAQHGELLDVLQALPCDVMISGYKSPLYAEALAGWRSFSFRVPIRGGRWAIETVWCNYPEPTELHDYSFVGRNKRDRERLARRRRNWSQRLDRLPAIERQALLTAIVGRGR
jgi:DNA adenine methylase